MYAFLCALWPYLAGGLVAWLVCGRLAHKLKYQPAPRERIVEKIVEVRPDEAAAPVSRAMAPMDDAGIDGAALAEARARVSALEAELDALRVTPSINRDRAAEAGFELRAFPDADDLTAIEGIGPKICEVLHDGGLRRFTDLAASEVSHIEAVLSAAGPRFTLARPGTWPAQAALAAANHWEALKAWQDVLDGGEEVKS